jgi:tryptophanyl-tRNA synthetase
MYMRGGFGYGEIKKRLADAADTFLEPVRLRRQELVCDDRFVRKSLDAGRQRARTVAAEVLGRAQKACGLR